MYKGKFICAVILAGGSSQRMGSDKITALLCGTPVLLYSVRQFAAIADEIIIACADTEKIGGILSGERFNIPVKTVKGGKTRAHSAENAAYACSDCCDIITVHDAARPLVTGDIITASLDGAIFHGASAAAVMLKDTVKQIDSDGCVISTPARDTLRAVQTPQSFDFSLYKKAMAGCNPETVTDDAGMIEQYGHKVMLTPGSYRNIKLTTPEDFLIAKSFLQADISEKERHMRTGHGYDVHRLVENRKLILCGTEIPNSENLGLLGHSDADVAVHALMDAILGAAALGDIGQHFPDSDPQYKGISSIKLLTNVMALIKSKGYTVGNADITIIAEKPKLARYIPEMRRVLSEAMEIPMDCISVKATTEEGLGLAGAGIAAHSVVTLL